MCAMGAHTETAVQFCCLFSQKVGPNEDAERGHAALPKSNCLLRNLRSRETSTADTKAGLILNYRCAGAHCRSGAPKARVRSADGVVLNGGVFSMKGVCYFLMMGRTSLIGLAPGVCGTSTHGLCGASPLAPRGYALTL